MLIAGLRVAVKEMPRALLAKAEWHCRHDEFGPCMADLRTFLKTPRGPNHEAAERWLGELRKQGKITIPGGLLGLGATGGSCAWPNHGAAERWLGELGRLRFGAGSLGRA